MTVSAAAAAMQRFQALAIHTLDARVDDGGRLLEARTTRHDMTRAVSLSKLHSFDIVALRTCYMDSLSCSSGVGLFASSLVFYSYIYVYISLSIYI